MAIKQSGGFFSDFRLNSNPGHLSYYAMRISGIALAVYVFAHIYSLHWVTETAKTSNPWDGINSWNKFIAGYDSKVGHIIEYLLLLAVVFHMFNGVRLVIIDWLELSKKANRMLYVAVLCMLAVCAVAAPVFFPEIFGRVG
jgi:succinate dehydrogenase / fumarate reductase, cytochrome b subunit